MSFPRTIRHPSGDAIELDVVDGELIDVAIKQGPHEICRLVFTGPQLDVLIQSLQYAREKVKS